MKFRKMFCNALMAGMLAASFGSVSVFAEDTEVQITADTDKESYTGTEPITETVTIENGSEAVLQEIRVYGDIPEGYDVEIADGTVDEGIWLKDAGNAEAGQTKSVEVRFTKKDTEPVASEEPTASPEPSPTPTPKPTETPKPGPGGKTANTSDTNNTALWLGMLGLSIAMIGFVFYARKGRKTAMFLLALALGASTLSVTPAKAEGEPLDLSDYSLVWEENFDGAELNRNDWNVELHVPGWVNAELQAYVDSEENIYLEDGHLVLKPVKNGDEYTSGRVNTMGKHDFKYGVFEARAKVPAGKGYLPAFWMMPTVESRYGQWPRCGEIDIMEVMGQETNLAYGTIHYGNPHAQNQGTYVTDGDYSEEYHTYAVEWLPGKIAWYIDGVKYYETSDWYSTTEGKGTVTYPAPFDQPFYIILNLAIGGSWVGYPDETTTYEDQEFDIDYVKVYQKDSYDENVTRPEKEPVVMRESDATGNYLVNGSFAEMDPWELTLAQGGEATSEIKDGEITITTANAGSQDYAVQLRQRNVPIEKGITYIASFDAYADTERSGLVAVEGGDDSSWTRYLNDTKFTAGPEKKHYEFEFTMEEDSDATSVFEFNLGNTDPASPIHISNVRLEKKRVVREFSKTITVDGEEVTLHSAVVYVVAAPEAEEGKGVLSDGNYIYNGEFQEGPDRKDYWESNGEVTVTPLEDGRRLKVVVEGDTAVEVFQKDVALPHNGRFDLSFDAQGDIDSAIGVKIADTAYMFELDGTPQTFSNLKIETKDADFDNTLTFLFVKGTYYIDNVRLIEDALIKNGSFNAGLAGFEPYLYTPTNATYIIDSQLEDNAFDITIDDTGDQDWHIQLKQTGIPLAENSCYKLTLKMKSSLDRKIMVALQRDGNREETKDDWTPYLQKVVDVVGDYTNYEFYFKMNPGTEPKTDPNTCFSISMGAVDGVQITQQHRIFIDDIELVEIDESEMPQEEIPAIEIGTNFLANGDFENGEEGWTGFGDAISPAVGKTSVVDGKAVAEIEDYGSEDWNVQLKHFGLTLEKGASYKLTFKGSSTAARDITVNLMSSTYEWYGGSGFTLDPEEKEFTLEFTMNNDTNVDAGLFISMGKTENPAAST
ncbi:MAG: carbohydrate binding domain-containing protein, partial [Solobacterium sp.]|nr:carbohydrate binding domain-containing protein [Solobacterium sp.]